jgi:hypothetical protein
MTLKKREEFVRDYPYGYDDPPAKARHMIRLRPQEMVEITQERIRIKGWRALDVTKTAIRGAILEVLYS